MSQAEANALWGRALSDELARSGVREVVLAPGLAAHVVKVCAAMKPFLDYLKDVTG